MGQPQSTRVWGPTAPVPTQLHLLWSLWPWASLSSSLSLSYSYKQGRVHVTAQFGLFGGYWAGRGGLDSLQTQAHNQEGATREGQVAVGV